RESLHVSPGRLDEIETRLAVIERLKRKYGASVEDVLAFGEKCRAELREMGSPEERERALGQEREALAARYLAAATTLSRKRRTAARDLEKKVQGELALLAMERTRFQVAFTPDVPTPSAEDTSGWNERGLETAEFLLSPNPGEDLRPLARIASGGELSRVMLGIKTLAATSRHEFSDRGDRPPSASAPGLIFDEVDAGIGGRVADVVGRKLSASVW